MCVCVCVCASVGKLASWSVEKIVKKFCLALEQRLCLRLPLKCELLSELVLRIFLSNLFVVCFYLHTHTPRQTWGPFHTQRHQSSRSLYLTFSFSPLIGLVHCSFPSFTSLHLIYSFVETLVPCHFLCLPISCFAFQ